MAGRATQSVTFPAAAAGTGRPVAGLTGFRRGAGRGFSLLELVVVIAIISALLVVAIDRLWALQVDAERAAMEHVVGSLQSAIGIKVAKHWVDQDFEGIRGLAGSNPMDQLAEVPKNYLGVRRRSEVAGSAGAWYFDSERRELVYRVRNTDFFRGGSGPPAEARFVIEVLHGQPSRKAGGRPEIQGVRLAAVTPYGWSHSATAESLSQN